MVEHKMTFPFEVFLHQIAGENGDGHLERLFQMLNDAPETSARNILILQVVDAAMKQFSHLGDWTARFNALMDMPEGQRYGRLPGPSDMY